ncbi:MAG: DUF2171 domain-containing protein [Meiothermus sp.]|nr:DUF2171 domain-containing protein [Meiothermus sp.]
MIEPRMLVRSSGPAGMSGLPGEDVGVVARVEGGYIELTGGAPGAPDLIPLEWVDRVDGNTVYLTPDLQTLKREGVRR